MSAKERLPPKRFSTTASIASLEKNDHDHDDMVMMTMILSLIRTVTTRVMMTMNVITILVIRGQNSEIHLTEDMRPCSKAQSSTTRP